MKKKPTGKKGRVKKPPVTLSTTKKDDGTYEVSDEEYDAAFNKELAHEYELLVSTGREMLHQMLRVGAMLNWAKSVHGSYGNWLDWLEENQPQIQERMAQHCMDFDRERKFIMANPQTISDLSSGITELRKKRVLERGRKGAKETVKHLEYIADYLDEEEKEEEEEAKKWRKKLGKEYAEKDEKITIQNARAEARRIRDQQYVYLYKALKATPRKIKVQVLKDVIEEDRFGHIFTLGKKEARKERAFMVKDVEDGGRPEDAFLIDEEEEEKEKEKRKERAEHRRRLAERAGKKKAKKKKLRKSTRRKR